jgi:8-oxo-dGTP pyrophosphatase MutT (NUDIX family)
LEDEETERLLVEEEEERVWGNQVRRPRPPGFPHVGERRVPLPNNSLDEEEEGVLVDGEDRVIGHAPRSEMRARNLLHRGTAVAVRNSAGDIYVHRRTRTKDIFPGLYDMFVGGLVVYGESYDDCARREVAEELGIVGPTPVPLFKHLYPGPENRCWTAIYEVTWDGPIVHQETEIEWGAFLSLAELEQRLDEWSFVPDGEEIYRRYAAGPPFSCP